MLALFHFLVIAVNVFTMWYDQTYVDIPLPKNLENMPFKARLMFFTVWCMVLQTVYFASALLNDFIGTNAASPKNPPLPRMIKDTLFGVAYPCAVFVSVVFWTIYFAHREIIYPECIAKVYPVWVNHVMHTLITPFIILESTFCNITFPPRKLGLPLLMGFVTFYLSYILTAYFMTGQFGYPFLDLAGWPMVFLFFSASPVYTMGTYLMCEKIYHYVFNPNLFGKSKWSYKE